MQVAHSFRKSKVVDRLRERLDNSIPWPTFDLDLKPDDFDDDSDDDSESSHMSDIDSEGLALGEFGDDDEEDE